MAKIEKDIAIADKQTLDSVKEDTEYIRKGLFGGSDTSEDSGDSGDSANNPFSDIKNDLSSMLTDLKSDLSSIAANVMLCSKNQKIAKYHFVNRTGTISIYDSIESRIFGFADKIAVDSFKFDDSAPIHVSILSNVRQNIASDNDDKVFSILHYAYYNGEKYVIEPVYARTSAITSKYFEIPGAYDSEHPTYVEITLHYTDKVIPDFISVTSNLENAARITTRAFVGPVSGGGVYDDNGNRIFEFTGVVPQIILWQYETVKLTESDISVPVTPDDTEKTTEVTSTGLPGIVGTLDLVDENSFTKTI